jgi:hypothetical protein
MLRANTLPRAEMDDGSACCAQSRTQTQFEVRSMQRITQLRAAASMSSLLAALFGGTVGKEGRIDSRFDRRERPEIVGDRNGVYK